MERTSTRQSGWWGYLAVFSWIFCRALEVLERWKLPVKVSRAMERRTGCPATSRLAEKSKYWER